MNDALRLLRVYHDMKAVKLAELLGISNSYLSEIERGKKKISVDLVKKYAEVFNTTASSIMLFAEGLEDKKKRNFKSFISHNLLKLLSKVENENSERIPAK